MTIKNELDSFLERKELIQDVIDRLLSNPEYKQQLLDLNKKYPSLKDYNRNLEKSRIDGNNLLQ